MKHPSLSHYLKQKAHPTWHKMVNRKLRALTSPLLKQTMPEDNMTIEQCMYHLGIATFRKDLILDINKSIMQTVGKYCYIQEWAQELKDMFDNTNLMITSLNQMAHAIIQESQKGTDHE